jgi:uncharacterized membrane protein
VVRRPLGPGARSGLRLDTFIGGLFRVLAFVVAWASVAAGAWMLWRMTREGR